MDPLTQGTLGAAAALALVDKRCPFGWGTVALLGAAGGMAPDLDILIRSADDPLLAIEYHRHFTHSLAFIPIGGPLTALPLMLLSRLRRQARWVVLLTTLGYATHALLDACTTYGTLLFWPFSTYRVSWSFISVIDPLFTLPLLSCVVICVWRKSRAFVLSGLGWGGFYMALCVVQQQRAASAQAAIAASRGHRVERAAVFPSFANNVSWRAVYQSGDRYHVDQIRAKWNGRTCVSTGTSVAVVGPVGPVGPAAPVGSGGSSGSARPEEPTKLAPAVLRGETLLRWFANDWVAYDPSEPSVLGDLRYSLEPMGVRPVWGIRRVSGTNEHSGKDVHAPLTGVQWVNNNAEREVSWSAFVSLVFEDATDAHCF